MVVEEEEGAHLLTPVGVEEEVEEDQHLISEEVEEEEGHLPPQEEVEAGTCRLTERLAVEGEVGADMWVRSRRAERGGQCPWLKGEVVVEEEEQARWGLGYQEEWEEEAGCHWRGWRRLARWGLKVEAQRCQDWIYIQDKKTFSCCEQL